MVDSGRKQREGRQKLGFRSCSVSCWEKRERPQPKPGSSDRFLSQAEASTALLGLKRLRRACQSLVSWAPSWGRSRLGEGAGKAKESE